MRNKIKTSKIIIAILITIMAVIITGASYAENETDTNNNIDTTNNTTDKNTQNNTNNDTNTSNTENKTNGETNTTGGQTDTNKNKKSNDANLSDFGIKPNDFTGFKPGITTYQVTVPEDVDTVEIYAKPKSSKAILSGTGKKKLEIGKNTFEVVVTAEDGTTKTYILEITREEAKDENTEDVQERYSGDGLASLEIENLELLPKFDTNVYEYRVKYIGEKEKLEIVAKGTDPYYNVDITGNSELKEGENIITILVSDPDGNNVATYQIIVNKSIVDEEALAKEQEEKQKAEQKKKMLIAGGIAAVLVIAIIVFLVIRNRRNRAWAEDYSVPYTGLNDDEDNFYEENANMQEDYNQENEEPEGQTEKEKARQAFLSNYNSDNDVNDYEEVVEEPRRRHKGKRFK